MARPWWAIAGRNARDSGRSTACPAAILREITPADARMEGTSVNAAYSRPSPLREGGRPGPGKGWVPMSEEPPREALDEISPGYANYVLGVLFLVYVINFIDRQVLSVFIGPIKEEFGVSDTAMGLLVGFAFALFYTVAGIPIARWADRGNRRTIIAIGLAVWSTMTVASGRIEQVSGRPYPGSADDSLYRLAVRYFDEDHSVRSDPRIDTANVWYWDAQLQAVVPTVVQQDIFAPVMAMRCCEEALNLRGDNGDALALWRHCYYEKQYFNI